MPVAERDYMARPSERRWLLRPWLIAVLVGWLTLASEAGGWLMDATAWVLAVTGFVVGCVLFAAFVRWLFSPPRCC